MALEHVEVCASEALKVEAVDLFAGVVIENRNVVGVCETQPRFQACGATLTSFFHSNARRKSCGLDAGPASEGSPDTLPLIWERLSMFRDTRSANLNSAGGDCAEIG